MPTKAQNSRLGTRYDITVHAFKPNAVGIGRNSPNSHVAGPKYAAGESRGTAHLALKGIARPCPEISAAVVYVNPFSGPAYVEVVGDPPAVQIYGVPGRNANAKFSCRSGR
jgi:hypothetical protein